MTVRIKTHGLSDRTFLYSGIVTVRSTGALLLLGRYSDQQQVVLPMVNVAEILLDEMGAGLTGPVHS